MSDGGGFFGAGMPTFGAGPPVRKDTGLFGGGAPSTGGGGLFGGAPSTGGGGLFGGGYPSSTMPPKGSQLIPKPTERTRLEAYEPFTIQGTDQGQSLVNFFLMSPRQKETRRLPLQIKGKPMLDGLLPLNSNWMFEYAEYNCGDDSVVMIFRGIDRNSDYFLRIEKNFRGKWKTTLNLQNVSTEVKPPKLVHWENIRPPKVLPEALAHYPKPEFGAVELFALYVTEKGLGCVRWKLYNVKEDRRGDLEFAGAEPKIRVGFDFGIEVYVGDERVHEYAIALMNPGTTGLERHLKNLNDLIELKVPELTGKDDRLCLWTKAIEHISPINAKFDQEWRFDPHNRV